MSPAICPRLNVSPFQRDEKRTRLNAQDPAPAPPAPFVHNAPRCLPRNAKDPAPERVKRPTFTRAKAPTFTEKRKTHRKTQNARARKARAVYPSRNTRGLRNAKLPRNAKRPRREMRLGRSLSKTHRFRTDRVNGSDLRNRYPCRSRRR